MLQDSNTALLYDTYIKNYLSSKHNFIDIIQQVPIRGPMCGVTIIHLSKELYARMFAIWSLMYTINKYFKTSYLDKIKITKRRGGSKKKKKKVLKRVKLHGSIKPSIYIYNSVLTLSDLYKYECIYALIPIDKMQILKERYSENGIKLFKNVPYEVVKLIYWCGNTLFSAYSGTFEDELIINLMEGLNYGSMPEVKVLFKYFLATKDLSKIDKLKINVGHRDDMLKSIVTFLV